MNDKKDIIYAMTLQISKITLKVRFPCSICCSIKIGTIADTQMAMRENYREMWNCGTAKLI